MLVKFAFFAFLYMCVKFAFLELFFSYLRCKNSGICPGTARLHMNNLDNIIPIHSHAEVCKEFENAENVIRFRNAVREALNHHWFN